MIGLSIEPVQQLAYTWHDRLVADVLTVRGSKPRRLDLQTKGISAWATSTPKLNG
jgi:hypothetical protein